MQSQQDPSTFMIAEQGQACENNISRSNVNKAEHLIHQNTISYQISAQPDKHEKYDQPIVQMLRFQINSYFSTIMWILERKLYQRIKLEKKGWFDIGNLYKVGNIAEIFRNYQILSKSRRKRNLLKNALNNSVLKKKKNFVKLRRSIRIQSQAQKVFYFQFSKNKQQYQNSFSSSAQSKTEENNRPNLQSIVRSLNQHIQSRQKKSEKMQMEEEVIGSPRIVEQEKMQIEGEEHLQVPYTEHKHTNCMGYQMYCSFAQIGMQKGFNKILLSQKDCQKYLNHEIRWGFVYLKDSFYGSVNEIDQIFNSLILSNQESAPFRSFKLIKLDQLVQKYQPECAELNKKLMEYSKYAEKQKANQVIKQSHHHQNQVKKQKSNNCNSSQPPNMLSISEQYEELVQRQFPAKVMSINKNATTINSQQTLVKTPTTIFQKRQFKTESPSKKSFDEQNKYPQKQTIEEDELLHRNVSGDSREEKSQKGEVNNRGLRGKRSSQYQRNKVKTADFSRRINLRSRKKQPDEKQQSQPKYNLRQRGSRQKKINYKKMNEGGNDF